MRLTLFVVMLSSFAVLAGPRDPGRDPFTPPRGPSPPPPATSTCDHTLCRISLDALRLVAIIRDGVVAEAIFEDLQGTGLRARRNSQIGTQGGRISEIDRSCVTVTDYVPTAEGRPIERATRVCLPEAVAEVHELMSDRIVRVP